MDGSAAITAASAANIAQNRRMDLLLMIDIGFSNEVNEKGQANYNRLGRRSAV
jgi:hypothetical protein